MKKLKLLILTILVFGFVAGNCLAVELLGVDIHGFASQGYMKTTGNNFFGDTKDGTLRFNEIGLNFGKDFFDDLHVGFQLLSRDFGSYGGNNVNLDWGFVDYRWKNWLGVRAGRIKAPKGLYNETRDIDMLRTTILLPQSVYPEILREVDLSLDGGGLYGYVDLGNFGGISYQGLYGKRDIGPNEAASQAIQGTTATFTTVENDGIDIKSKYVMALTWDTPLSGLRVGATYDSSDIYAPGHVDMNSGPWKVGDASDTDFKKYTDTVVSAEYTYGNLIVAAEYIQTDKRFKHIFGGTSGGVPSGTSGSVPSGTSGSVPAGTSGSVPGDTSGSVPSGTSGSVPSGTSGNISADTSGGMEGMISDGWYLSSSYQFTDWFTLGGYYSESYNDMDDRNGKDLASSGSSNANRAYFKDLCLTTEFTINHSWVLKLEGHRFIGTNGISPLDQVADENGNYFAETDWSMFAAKVTYSF